MSIVLGEPPRGFVREEFERRTGFLQREMLEMGVDVVFFTTEAEFRYFSGFRTQFWESPTRPWFLVVPREGLPVAVIPEIGVLGFEDTWIEDVRSWSSPCPEDDGVSLLGRTLGEFSDCFGCIGGMFGPETYLRMPYRNFRLLEGSLGGRECVDVSGVMRKLRSLKSSSEIEKIRHACGLTSGGFDHLRGVLRMGMTEREACREMHMELLRLGADRCPYLIAGSGRGGYESIIMGPTDRVLEDGDILVIDAGVDFEGYFSDFDRNFGFGRLDGASVSAYGVLYEALEAGLLEACPGATTGSVWRAMRDILERGGSQGAGVGRLGHGLGMQLTEWPSIVEGGAEELSPGMVLTLEPSMSFSGGKMMVHEENIVITETGCELLHSRTCEEIPLIA
jgi:Xaa-Pro aminopeptidase